MKKITRRSALLGAGGLAAYALSKVFRAELPNTSDAGKIIGSTSATTLNDASELSATPIHQHLILKDDYNHTIHASIRAALKEAKQSNRPLNVGAARHSMGGQAIPRDGIAVTKSRKQIMILVWRLHFQSMLMGGRYHSVQWDRLCEQSE